ncbi:MAG: lysine/arginine/ornithine ABC transporter substrate-binding protein [Pseudomonadota bacterium]
MKLTSLVVAAGLMLAGGTAYAQDVVKIGTEGAYPPWNETDTAGNLVGFEIDLGNAMCEKMGVTCEWIAQDWDGIIPALMNGRYDLIMAGMSITDERRQAINFSSGYVSDPATFVAAADSDLIAAQSLDEVKGAIEGKAVGVQGATIHQNFLDQEMAGLIDLRTYDTQENLELDLAAGRIDAALADRAAWEAFFATDSGADFTVFGPPFSGSEYPVFGEGVGVGVRKEDSDLLAKVNEAMAALKADGTVKTLSEQYIGYDITMY